MGAYHNEIITVLPSAARTTAQTVDMENMHNRGVKLVIDVTAGTPGLTVTIQGKDHTSGKYYDILSSAAISSTGTTVLTVYPSATAEDNVTANDVIPRYWRVSVAVSDSDSVTYSIGACTIR